MEGGNCLFGEVDVFGAKNSILPIIAAAILAKRGDTVIHNVPKIEDIAILLKILENLGATVDYRPNTKSLEINCEEINEYQCPSHLVKKIRGSILLIGSMLARFGIVESAIPGGCIIGKRKNNVHFKGLQRLGATIEYGEELIIAKAKRLKGTRCYLDYPSHTGTETIMLAACLAKGITTIINAACEPEVVDLAFFLNKMGAKIIGAGTPIITIKGVKNMRSVEYIAFPSRLETYFFTAAAAITKGELIIKNAFTKNTIVFKKFRQMGVKIKKLDKETLLVKNANDLEPVNITTLPFPGFPTDFQPQMSVLLSNANGNSIVTETVFKNRFKHIYELKRLGALIKRRANKIFITGVSNLKGNSVKAYDIQTGAALLLSALIANKKTIISNIYHIDRGYEQLENRLTQLGAKISRVNDKPDKSFLYDFL
ncbi:MAG: UDP-N-acetylglucosamine 1-carboxyvinyltransferase [Promethearchaeota archaeon]